MIFMVRIIRGAGLAGATLAAIFGAAFAAPSQALDYDGGPVVPVLVAHSEASLIASDLGLNADPGILVDEPAPVPAAEEESAFIPDEDGSAEAETIIPRTLADLVGDLASAAPADREQECLAGAVYFEAKGESLAGQLSVAEVVLNRARSGRFPSSLCGVVTQRHQFSFIRGGRFPPIARASLAWRKAVAIARIATDDLADSPAPRALYFHANYVAPRWRGLTRVAAVGNHIFYR